MHQGQCFACARWMLQAAAAPDHHDLHPQPKIHEQKLMDKAAVGTAASAKIRLREIECGSEGIGAIINRRNRFSLAGV